MTKHHRQKLNRSLNQFSTLPFLINQIKKSFANQYFREKLFTEKKSSSVGFDALFAIVKVCLINEETQSKVKDNDCNNS